MAAKKPKSPPEQSTSVVLADSLGAVVEGITGVAASSRSDLALSIGHVFQRMRGGEFLSELLKEWNQFRDKGRVKDDYQKSEQHKVCLQELFDFLSKDSPDEIRFSVLKKILLVAAGETKSTRESLAPQQYMRIGRQLSDGEILVLFACYRALKDESDIAWRTEQNVSAGVWAKRIAAMSGLEHPELVEIHEMALEEKRLINRRLHGDRSGVQLKSSYRLTSLGLMFCEYVASYDEDT
jgi:hypothetical protein